MEDTATHPERQRRLLYGRRKGPKLRGRQAELLDTLLPQLALNIEKDKDPRAYFSAPVSDVWLEIGFGAGEHLHALAQAHPDTGLIGAEPFINGVAKLLSKLAPGEGDSAPEDGGNGGAEGSRPDRGGSLLPEAIRFVRQRGS